MTYELCSRFRGFLPVVIDVETGGTHPVQDALLELAAITIKMDEKGLLHPDQTFHYHVVPFKGARLDPASLAFNKIDPYHPFRFALEEKEVLTPFFNAIQKECKEKKCTRAIIVGHNAWFDLHFINAAITRTHLTKKNPFHRFSSLDTATLSALSYGQTVLARALKAAQLPFESEKAHSALYDAQSTASLFCTIINNFQKLGGWTQTV